MPPQTTTATTLDWKTRLTRLLIKCGLWTGTFALLVWLLGLQPTWQLIVLAVACMLVDPVRAQGKDRITRCVQRFIKLAVWGVAFVSLCWLLSLQPTWQLLVLAAVTSLADDALDLWLPTSA
jgi:hypothetical protein